MSSSPASPSKPFAFKHQQSNGSSPFLFEDQGDSFITFNHLFFSAWQP